MDKPSQLYSIFRNRTRGNCWPKTLNAIQQQNAPSAPCCSLGLPARAPCRSNRGVAKKEAAYNVLIEKPVDKQPQTHASAIRIARDPAREKQRAFSWPTAAWQDPTKHTQGQRRGQQRKEQRADTLNVPSARPNLSFPPASSTCLNTELKTKAHLQCRGPGTVCALLAPVFAPPAVNNSFPKRRNARGILSKMN